MTQGTIQIPMIHTIDTKTVMTIGMTTTIPMLHLQDMEIIVITQTASAIVHIMMGIEVVATAKVQPDLVAMQVVMVKNALVLVLPSF